MGREIDDWWWRIDEIPRFWDVNVVKKALFAEKRMGSFLLDIRWEVSYQYSDVR